MEEKNDQDVSMKDVAKPPIKRKKDKSTKGRTLTTTTIKSPPFTYISLELISSIPSLTHQTKLDELTIRSYITSALTQFLGLTGSAISVDILKVEENRRECWVRVPREEAAAVMAAVGGWVGNGDGKDGDERESVGWRVRGSGGWLGGVLGRREQERVWND